VMVSKLVRASHHLRYQISAHITKAQRVVTSHTRCNTDRSE
jgi:hypothetical protein